MDTFIEHSELCAATAKKLNVGADQVDKTVTEYASQMILLMKEKRPTNYKDRLTVKTPIVAAQVTLDKEEIVTENGKKYKVEEQYCVRYGMHAKLLQALNEGLEVAKTLLTDTTKDGQIKVSKKAA